MPIQKVYKLSYRTLKKYSSTILTDKGVKLDRFGFEK